MGLGMVRLDLGMDRDLCRRQFESAVVVVVMFCGSRWAHRLILRKVRR